MTMKWDQEIPHQPDFNRMPHRAPENAVYRDSVPDHLANNPYYRALPGYRSTEEVVELVRKNNRAVTRSLQGMPYLARKELIDQVGNAIIPLRRHISLEEMIGVTVRNAYVDRPLNFTTILSNIERIDPNNPGSGGVTSYAEGSVGTGALFGAPGQGKTALLKRLLMSFPQIIRHHEFAGEALNVTQLVWLYISLPPKASTLALLVWITATLDFLLGTSYLRELEKQKTLTLKARAVARWLTVHAVGTIVCDELQNIKVGSSHERDLVENTFQELINWTYTRFIFVGTRESESAIRSAALKRRMVGERGRKTWDPLRDQDWEEFISELWTWQVTLPYTPMDTALKTHLLLLSGGVPDYAKRLFTIAQSLVISGRKKDEILTPELFNVAHGMLPEPEQRMARAAAQELRNRVAEMRKKSA